MPPIFWPTSANIIAEYNQISRRKPASGFSHSFGNYVDTDLISEGISRGFQIRAFSTRLVREMHRRNVRRSRASGRLSCR
jgi:hypothetical protein